MVKVMCVSLFLLQHEPISFQKIDEIAQIDPIRELTTESKQFLWQNRYVKVIFAFNCSDISYLF